jgi:hypothetical protein
MSMLGNGSGKKKKKKKRNRYASLARSSSQAGKLARPLEGKEEENNNKAVAQSSRSQTPNTQRKENPPAAPHQSPGFTAKASPPSSTPKQSSCGVANTSEHTGFHYCLPAAAGAAAKSTLA